MERNERMNIIIGLLVIVLAITGITVLLFHFAGRIIRRYNKIQQKSQKKSALYRLEGVFYE